MKIIEVLKLDNWLLPANEDSKAVGDPLLITYMMFLKDEQLGTCELKGFCALLTYPGCPSDLLCS